MSRASLTGLRVLLTRPQGEGAEEWAAAFALAGAVPLSYPTIAITPPESWQALDQAMARLDSYDWMVFTSQTAVGFFVSHLPTGQFQTGMRTKMAAVGRSTAQAIERRGGRVALVATDSRQEGLADALRDLPPGARVLCPLAASGRLLLAQSLRARGCTVDVVTVYRTAPRTDLPAPPEFDVATFASPSALRALVKGLGPQALAGKTVAVIGPTTAEEAESSGLRAVVAETPDVDALVLAIAKSRSNQGGF
jgi:uroporphyrinogen-III synthase